MDISSANGVQKFIEGVKAHMRENCLDYYILKSGDCHLSEYAAPSLNVIQFMTGFTGSLAFVVISIHHDKPFILVDGRYHVQVEQEVNSDMFSIVKLKKPFSVELNYIWKDHTGSIIICLEELCFSESFVNVLEHCSTPKLRLNITAVSYYSWLAVFEKPILNKDICIFESQVVSTDEHLSDLMDKVPTGTVLLTDLTEIAYVLNLRGSTIPFIPVFYAYLIIDITNKEMILFVDSETEIHVDSSLFKVNIRSYSEFDEEFCQNVSRPLIGMTPLPLNIASKIKFDAKTSSVIARDQARKSVKEVENIQVACIMDSLNIVRLIKWMNETPSISEVTISKKMEEFRNQQHCYKGPSFETIVGCDANGAIIHYRPTVETQLPVVDGSIVLLDTGAHYPFGTTDTSRTFCVGEKVDESVKFAYTSVLKGVIGMTTQQFPKDTSLKQLGAFSRSILWNYGLDFRHGVSHGVGLYNTVHEPLDEVNDRTRYGGPRLAEGNVLTIEPGYYQSDPSVRSFGIRLENIVTVVKADEHKTEGLIFQQEFLKFKTLTFVPYDHKLIDFERLTTPEMQWLKDYNEMCVEKLRTVSNDESLFHFLESYVQMPEF
ncbi:hypothetical protein PCE1_003839 [Barthelona sp. PCE]